MIYLAYIVIAYAAIRCAVAMGNWLLQTRLPGTSCTGTSQPLVSVLIPARNEEKNLPHLLEDLGKMQYREIEILVYDDASEDHTAEVVLQYQKALPFIRLIRGKGLPAGWLGKNHACYQLARHAKGDYLLFLDADVRLGPLLISQSLTYLQKHRLSLLSIFPQQVMKSFGERCTVPLMNWILTSMLPLPLIRRNRWSSFSAANGQFMLFKTENYRCNQWHQLLKSDMVEDIHIMQYSKEAGYRNHTLLSNGQIRCRMYSGANKAVSGFAKNVLAFFGNSIPFAGFHLLVTNLGVVPVFFAPPALQLTWLGLIVIIRLTTSAASRQNPLLNLLLMPVQQVMFALFFARAVGIRAGKGYQWKGRKI